MNGLSALALYEGQLRRAGWRVQLRTTEGRSCLEGFAEGGAVVMAVAKGRRRRCSFYLFPAWAEGQCPWLTVAEDAWTYFVEHRELPPGAAAHVPSSNCECAKRRFPTEARASDALLSAKIKRALDETSVRRERRVYRCPADDRAWHMTRKSRYYEPTNRGQRP